MKIKFVSLTMENFKGINSLKINFSESKTIISGANETGKTSIADAIAYVLTGKNSLGESTFDVLPVGKKNVSSSVLLDLEIISDEKVKPVSLCRKYEAQTNKNKEFTGEYKTVCEINGIKTGPKDFEKWVAENICKPEIFRLIHEVRYFTENIQGNGKEKTWEAQRRLLMSTCEIPSDIELASENPDFSELLDGLSRYEDASQYLMFLKGKEKEVENKITDYNTKMGFYQEEIGKLPNVSEEELLKKHKILSNEMHEISSKIQEDIEKKKEAIQVKIQDIVNESREKYKEVEKEIEQSFDKRCNFLNQKKDLELNITLIKSKIKELDSNDGICKSCWQRLPKKVILTNKKERASLLLMLEKKQKELDKVKKKIDKLPTAFEQWKFPEKARAMETEYQSVGNRENYKDDYNRIDSIREELKQIEMDSLTFKSIQRYKDEMDTLKKFLDAALDDRANIRRFIDMCTDFIQEKCKKVSATINGMFDDIRFDLFKFNKTNGELKECCDIYFKGIPYRSLSYSTKFYVSLLITLRFQKYFGVSMPIIIDNAESIDIHENFGCQEILLRKIEQICPGCGGHTGRRGIAGLWTCTSCGMKFIKRLEIVTE